MMLPPIGKQVIIRIQGRPWISKTDPEGIFFKVACRAGSETDWIWREFGPGIYDPDEVIEWWELPLQRKT